MSELPRPEPEPETVREEIERILDRPEFRDDRSLVERALDWVWDRLADLLPDDLGAGGSGAEGLVIVFVVALAVVVLVVGVRALVQMRSERSARGRQPGTTVVLGEEVDRAELETEASRAEAAGDWKTALIARYRAMIAELVARGVLPDLPGRTTGEYRTDLRLRLPAAADGFDDVTGRFEAAFYGDADVGPDDLESLRRSQRAIHAGAGR